MGEPLVESFNGRVRDELLNIEEFGSLIHARVLVEAWRTEYNTYRPHSSLGGLTPQQYARTRTTSQHSHKNWTQFQGPLSRHPACEGIVVHALPRGASKTADARAVPQAPVV